MTGKYFIEKLDLYEKEALLQMSSDMINAYESNPKLLTELLIRFLFFERLQSDEDRIIHNKAIEILYDLGIFQEGKELEIVQELLSFKEIPKVYKQEDDL